MIGNTFTAPVELKFTSDERGEFEGYGSVFGNEDSHGDVIVKGAFEKSLAEHKARGTMPALYIEHGPFAGTGDCLPAGVWTDMGEDDRGLHCRGKISALDTDYGRRIHSLMRDGALKGLSIAFRVPPDGAVFGKKPKRMLKSIDLHAVDLVTAPSNVEARVHSVKSTYALVDRERVVPILAKTITMHHQTLSAGDSPNKAEREEFLNSLQDVHEMLTGTRVPLATKGVPSTIRELETKLREELGLSHSQARAVAEHGFKALLPRDEDERKATVPDTEGLKVLESALSGFSLPKF